MQLVLNYWSDKENLALLLIYYCIVVIIVIIIMRPLLWLFVDLVWKLDMLDENKYDQCFNNTLEKNYFETEKTFTTTNKSNNDK